MAVGWDGATAETFEFLRQGGNFVRVVANIRALRATAPATRLVTSTVVSRRNVGEVSAIVSLAAIRERMRYSNVPPALRGLGITFLLVGLMAVGFMAFSGIQL